MRALSPQSNLRRVLALGATMFAVGGTLAESAGAAVPSRASFQNLATGLVLDSNYRGDVYAQPGNGGNFQKWTVTRSDYGTVTLTNVATGRCLDSNTDRVVYTLWCNGGSFQKWIVLDREYGTVVLRNLATGLVLDTSPWGDVYTMPENGGSYQKWFALSA